MGVNPAAVEAAALLAHYEVCSRIILEALHEIWRQRRGRRPTAGFQTVRTGDPETVW